MHIFVNVYSTYFYNFSMQFGSNFKKIRKECGFTQKDVAEKLRLSQSNVSDWENDVSRPEYENLIKLALLYNVSMEELLGLPEKFPNGFFFFE